MLQVGDPAPDFTLASDAGEEISLSKLRGRPVILYWYPRDDTPGCTVEACSFRDAYGEFEQAGAIVLGASADSVKSHQKFKSKYELPFTLLSDPEHAVAEQYGVWGKKKFMGREFDGIHRVTFLIDDHGVVRQVWPNVKPQEHVDEVLRSLREL